MGRVSLVGIATRYKLYGPGSNPGGGKRSFAHVQTNTGPPPLKSPVECVSGLLPEVKAAVVWR